MCEPDKMAFEKWYKEKMLDHKFYKLFRKNITIYLKVGFCAGYNALRKELDDKVVADNKNKTF